MSRARFALAACIAVIAVAVAAVPATAATSATATQTVKFTTQSAVQLNLSNNLYDFGVVDPLGVKTSTTNATVATVFANAPWSLSVAGTGAFKDGSTTPQTIPDSRMTVNGTALNNSTTAIPVSTGAATPVAGTATNLQYSLKLLFGDPSSTTAFSDTLTYTASTP
jgi:hypothetical protein